MRSAVREASKERSVKRAGRKVQREEGGAMKRVVNSNARLVCAVVLHFALLHAFPSSAETVKAADCTRDAKLDYWAAADVEFCRAVMDDVFKSAGLSVERVPFDARGMAVVSNADVICSAFRTPDLLKSHDFPIQPLGRMHYALYATPERAISMMSVRITEWPRLRVGYSPVSQGQNEDRQSYFDHARLSPEYVEYPTSAGAVEALKGGEIDVLFLYTPFGKRPDGLVEVVPIGARNVYFAVNKGKPELLKKLSAAYRGCYIDHVAKFDVLRMELLGIPTPKKRVRVAAYARGDLFTVSPDGERSGAFEMWMKAVCASARWTPDFVYGGYDESVADVKRGRLDLIGGLGFDSTRRDDFLFPHTPMGMLRVYLWTHPGNRRYKPGEPSTWKGMRVGMLAGTISAQRAKRQFDKEASGIVYREYATDHAMLKAYFSGEVDACIDVEMPELANEIALHLYASHPMYICTSKKRQDLFAELEKALDEVCDDFPKYMRMISEHHYGTRSEMAALTLKEADWLAKRVKDKRPIEVDFSPWPFAIRDDNGRATGLAALFQAEIARKTGLNVVPQEQTGIQTAEAKFMRGETKLWIPYPAKAKTATFGATSVFSLPVPQMVGEFYGAEDDYLEFEMFAGPGTPPELVSILRKAVSGIAPSHLQEMFMSAAAERRVVHRVFGFTSDELTKVIVTSLLAILLVATIYGGVMVRLLKREAARANKAAAAAEDHAQAKPRFLAMMSHELRTPLNAVIGFAEFLSREGLDEPRRKEYTEGILLSANALLELINDILDLSKLEAGAMKMRSGACDMRQLLNELPAIFGYRVRRRGVKLSVEMPPAKSMPMVALSQQGMRQILINLVGNAAKFTGEGSISVGADWDASTNTLHLEVRDTGRGISDEKMSKLFDPFVQDIAMRMQSSAGEMKGTGLGLPIVKRMVEAADGLISVKSVVGKGTVFSIDIPGLEVVEVASHAPRAAEETLKAALPERVLVVDDMTMNRKILGIHLKNIGVADVRYAENGEQALEIMKEWRPDLVLTDMWMPKMDGTQLAEAMRKERTFAEIPVVAVTADVDVGSTYDMSLFAKIIAKPVSVDKLQALFGAIG